jgi:hypothetical protein
MLLLFLRENRGFFTFLAMCSTFSSIPSFAKNLNNKLSLTVSTGYSQFSTFDPPNYEYGQLIADGRALGENQARLTGIPLGVIIDYQAIKKHYIWEVFGSARNYASIGAQGTGSDSGYNRTELTLKLGTRPSGKIPLSVFGTLGYRRSVYDNLSSYHSITAAHPGIGLKINLHNQLELKSSLSAAVLPTLTYKNSLRSDQFRDLKLRSYASYTELNYNIDQRTAIALGLDLEFAEVQLKNISEYRTFGLLVSDYESQSSHNKLGAHSLSLNLKKVLN